jgi:hypothetical protein
MLARGCGRLRPRCLEIRCSRHEQVASPGCRRCMPAAARCMSQATRPECATAGGTWRPRRSWRSLLHAPGRGPMGLEQLPKLAAPPVSAQLAARSGSKRQDRTTPGIARSGLVAETGGSAGRGPESTQSLVVLDLDRLPKPANPPVLAQPATCSRPRRQECAAPRTSSSRLPSQAPPPVLAPPAEAHNSGVPRTAGCCSSLLGQRMRRRRHALLRDADSGPRVLQKRERRCAAQPTAGSR